MNDPAPVALEVCLGENEPFGSVHVEMAAYCDFDAWMDQQSERLVARWIHTAAPASVRSSRRSDLGRAS